MAPSCAMWLKPLRHCRVRHCLCVDVAVYLHKIIEDDSSFKFVYSTFICKRELLYQSRSGCKACASSFVAHSSSDAWIFRFLFLFFSFSFCRFALRAAVLASSIAFLVSKFSCIPSTYGESGRMFLEVQPLIALRT